MHDYDDVLGLTRVREWQRLRRWLAYPLAVAAVGLAALVGHLELLGAMRVVVLLFAVALVARLAGFVPGLVALGLAIVACYYFFLPPAHSFALEDPQDLIRLLLFALVGWAIAGWIRPAWA
jgi:K+-sensing histidine kinase KdpD